MPNRHKGNRQSRVLQIFFLLTEESSYTRSVNNHTQRLEKLLKVIVTPAVRDLVLQYDIGGLMYFQDPAEVFILSYTAMIGDLSFSNFQKVITQLLAANDIAQLLS